MKRFVLLLLLAVLPLQITWAAGVAHCPHDGEDGVRISSTGELSPLVHGHAHDTDDGDAGHAAGAALDCSAFHLVALEPPAAWGHSLARASGTAPDVEYPGYKSHIPRGLDRPNWRFAA